MKNILKLLFKLDLINLSKFGGLIYGLESNQAGVKLRNKVKEINGNFAKPMLYEGGISRTTLH
jgi:hypothetical protein